MRIVRLVLIIWSTFIVLDLCFFQAHSQALSAEDLDPTVLERERKIALEKAVEDAAKSGKEIPADILAKRADGAAAKYAKDNALLSQVFVIDNKTPIAQVVEQAQHQQHDAEEADIEDPGRPLRSTATPHATVPAMKAAEPHARSRP